jgi:hypothetical protein
MLNRHNCQDNLIHPTANQLPVMLQSEPPNEYHENIHVKQLNLRLCTKKTQVLYPTQCYPGRNTNRWNNKGKGKGKVHPITGHEGPEGN